MFPFKMSEGKKKLQLQEEQLHPLQEKRGGRKATAPPASKPQNGTALHIQFTRKG
jgi:hypothetical protein